MSYILKALRKSEAERAKGTVPSLTTRHRRARPKRGSLWRSIAIAAIAVNTAILGVAYWQPNLLTWPDWRGFGQGGQAVAEAPPRPAPAKSDPPEIARQESPAILPPALERQARSSAAPGSAATATPPVAAKDPEGTGPGADVQAAAPSGPAEYRDGGDPPETLLTARVAGAYEQARRTSELTSDPAIGGKTADQAFPDLTPPPTPGRKPAAVRALATLAAADAAAFERLDALAAQIALTVPEAENPNGELQAQQDHYEKLPMLWQMPQSFRKNIPKLKIAVHVYAPEEAGRFVIVDRKKYWEGDDLAPGVFLEAIVPDGLVLAYDGQQFKLSSH